MDTPRIPVEYQISTRHYDDWFFHPSVCHVCKFLSDKDMIRCDCGMLSYCSEEHMEMDRVGVDENVGHGEICDVIKRLVCDESLLNFPGGEHHKWIEQKYKYVRLVEEELDRKMMPHEKRMFWFTRCCLICFKDAQLKTCKECYSVDHCDEHYHEISGGNEAHDHPCSQLKNWLYFEIKAINIYPIPQWRTFHNFPNKGDVDDILAFFNEYAPHIRLEGSNWLDLIYSDYLSLPLTAYNVIRKMKLLNYVRTRNTYVIHIVGASNMDKLYLPSWEVFLHVFCKPLQLIVVMIGTDLASDVEGGKLQTCREKCIPVRHELHFQYHRMSYHEYIGSVLYQAPNMVIGFEVNDRDSHTLTQFLLASIQSPYCSIILTTNTRLYAEKLRNKMKYFINVIDKRNRKQPVVEHNKFRSYRPYRDHIDGCIYYRNEYIIILKKR